MKILLSAFAFAPNAGSELGVGWHWAIELAVHHEITVVTDITRRILVERSEIKVPANLKIIYFRPSWLNSVPLNSKTASLLYTMWQFGLFKFARDLNRKSLFDVAIHCTYSVFRHPSFLGCLGIPFIFGPLGGGEDAPWALKKSIHGPEKIREIIRTCINKIVLLDPLLWVSYYLSTRILVSTEETRCALPWPFRKRAIIYSNLGIDSVPDIKPNKREPSMPFRILFAGRLLGWKGVHFAIRAVADARRRGVNIELTIIGSGSYARILRQLVASEDIGQYVIWYEHCPQKQLFSLYRSMHGFIFPSLHDSGGTVVLEAQANGLPVICLDLGGPATLVTPKTGFVIPTRGLDENGVVLGLTIALEKLANDEEARINMSINAIRHARSMNWKTRISGVLRIIDNL